jgi:hypothetical protein
VDRHKSVKSGPARYYVVRPAAASQLSKATLKNVSEPNLQSCKHLCVVFWNHVAIWQRLV